MPDFRFEMVLVIVGPAKQRRYKVLQMGSEEICGKRMNREFYIAQCRFDDLAVRGGKKDKEGCEDLALHLPRECVCREVDVRKSHLLSQSFTFELEHES